ncbi:hypothetical protein FGLOB1_10045 [Fusarium globosum]|uniref:Uncharacterized protein n=1 Tax=Fusarium globosum TaxID=78864 RepID=A0A8H6D308_9HYPO|nr:hypothetical protein FGLOB1_10045 [Fusarium globosum]
MNSNTTFTESALLEVNWEQTAWQIGFKLSERGFPARIAFDAFKIGQAVRAAYESSKGHHLQENYIQPPSPDDGVLTPQSMDDAQQDVATIQTDCEIPLPDHHSSLDSEPEQAETLASQTLNKVQADAEHTAASIEIHRWERDDSSNPGGLLFPSLGNPASTTEEILTLSPERSLTPPSVPSTSTQGTTTDASDAPANEEEGVNGLFIDMQTPGSFGCSATQVAIPLEPPQAPICIDLTGEDEPSDGGIRASKPQGEGRRKRKRGHANVHGEQLPLPQARKRSRRERDLGKNELRLRATEIVWERGNERMHQVAHRDGHKWSSEDFMQGTGRIVEMEVIVNNGAKQTLRLYKTGQADGQGILWEGDDGFGICKLSLTSEDIESMVGKDYRSVIKKCNYIKRDKHMKKYI